MEAGGAEGRRGFQGGGAVQGRTQGEGEGESGCQAQRVDIRDRNSPETGNH